MTRIHTGRLILTPADPWLTVDPRALRAALAALGFIGQPLPDDECRPGPPAAIPRECPPTRPDAGADNRTLEPSQAFLTGEGFLALLAFAGCAVNLRLTPQPGAGPFTYVRLVGPLASPLLLHSRNTRPPRCPLCRAPRRDWSEFLAAEADTAFPCPACGARQPAWMWDWKDRAGFGRYFLWVEEVFPGEAEPTPTFQAALAQLTACPWRHFYLQD